MPVRKDSVQIDTTGRGVALLPLRLVQADFKGLPELAYVTVAAFDESGKPTDTRYKFRAEKDYRNEYSDKNKYRDYLISLNLVPGNYRIAWLQFATTTSKSVQIEGVAPVFGDFRVEAGKVTYLGSLKATLRNRKCGELRIPHHSKTSKLIGGAAGVIPLLDLVVEGATASALGYSSGTFQLEVVNNVDRDVAVLRVEYPVLKAVAVESNRLLAIKSLSPEQVAAVCAKEQATEQATASGLGG